MNVTKIAAEAGNLYWETGSLSRESDTGQACLDVIGSDVTRVVVVPLLCPMTVLLSYRADEI